ncbi:hypothetical protein GUJ93_ZPchr0004g38425 [Zizania palustris]|uniref:Uncharacterized protein n=1 Tax=Zizania palustris TaxID=103762 RepID=A0A8J5SJZ9_ZIZPA|nr:hypothetical protein GUJ93_ZPchr0004g38425 [Zizania palustris]
MCVAAGAEVTVAEAAGAEEGGGLDGREVGRVPPVARERRKGAPARGGVWAARQRQGGGATRRGSGKGSGCGGGQEPGHSPQGGAPARGEWERGRVMAGCVARGGQGQGLGSTPAAGNSGDGASEAVGLRAETDEKGASRSVRSFLGNEWFRI